MEAGRGNGLSDDLRLSPLCGLRGGCCPVSLGCGVAVAEEIQMSLENEEVEDVLAALRDHFLDRLSPWEYTFVESVSHQWDEKGSLTDKQREKLDQIFERFARG